MTIDKAIDCNLSLLEFMKIENMLHPNCVFADDNFEALEMAISALQAQETKHSSESSLTQKGLDTVSLQQTCNQLATDTISRTAAIEAVEHITSSMSVCVNTDECHGMKRMQRQAVIELANLPFAQPKLNNQINLCDSCRHTYPDCPAGEEDVLYGNGKGGDNICACGKYEAEKRNTGHWVDAGSGMSMWPCKCSVCGGRQGATSKYCPDCGAKMKNNQFNFCDSCEHSKKSWDEPPCEGCCRGHSAYEPIEGK